jgi:hypothetical protein
MCLAVEKRALFCRDINAIKPSADVNLESRFHLRRIPALAMKVRGWFWCTKMKTG